MLLFFVLGAAGSAAQRYYTFHYRVADGLLSEQVRAVMPGGYGSMWVGTDGGLLRFDRRSFSSYNRGLDSYYIKAFARKADGSIVFACDTGVYAIEEHPDTAALRLLIPAAPLSNDTALHYPNGLFYTSRGALWASQPNGALARWQDGRLDIFSFGPGHRTGYSNSGFHFAESPEGRLFVAATTGQVYCFDAQAGSFSRVELARPMAPVHCLYAQGDTLWIGGQGLYRAQMKGGQLAGGQFFATDGKPITSIALALAQNQPLLIRDFRREHMQYIEPTDDYRFQSAVFIPMESAGQQRVVFCLYSIRKQAFDEMDLKMLQILADYLSIALKGQQYE